MKGKQFEVFMKINNWFKAQPRSTLDSYAKNKITIEDISRDCMSSNPKKLTPEGVVYFRKIAGLTVLLGQFYTCTFYLSIQSHSLASFKRKSSAYQLCRMPTIILEQKYQQICASAFSSKKQNLKSMCVSMRKIIRSDKGC